MSKKIISAHELKPTKLQEIDRKPTGTLTTADVDSAQLRRDRILSLATEEEKDRFAEMIAPRVEREEAIVVVKCSNPKCPFRGRNRRKKVGDPCPICAKRNYELEGEKFEAGVQVEMTGKELADFYDAEKRENERLLKEAEERSKAQALLGKAGIIFRRDQ